MKYEKKVIDTIEKCYALTTFSFDGEDHIVASAEKKNVCHTYRYDGTGMESLWEGEGGVMTMAQVPGKPILLSTQKFYSPNDSASAYIAYVMKKEGKWVGELLCDLPFVHRFGILQRGGINYLIACSLKSAHAFKNDWTCPGRVWVAELPENLTEFGKGHQLALTPLLSGLYKNHGFCKCVAEDGSDFAVIGAENGIWKIAPPAKRGGEWETEQLMDIPASDILYLDFDRDSERELLVLSPFHGDTLSVYKKQDGVFSKVYEREKKMPFIHAIWGCEIEGVPYAFVGNREEDRELVAVSFDQEKKEYRTELIDQGAGPANVMAFRDDGKPMLMAANRETDEVALYSLQ